MSRGRVARLGFRRVATRSIIAQMLVLAVGRSARSAEPLTSATSVCTPVIQAWLHRQSAPAPFRLLGVLRRPRRGNSGAAPPTLPPRTILAVTIAFIAVFIVVSFCSTSTIVTTVGAWWMLICVHASLGRFPRSRLSLYREAQEAFIISRPRSSWRPPAAWARCPQPALPAPPTRHGGNDGDMQISQALVTIICSSSGDRRMRLSLRRVLGVVALMN